MNTDTQEIQCPVNGEQFGSIISKKLSEFIQKYSTTDDRKEISRSTGISYSTVRYLINRSNSLTEDNSVALIAMIEKSIENCQKVSLESERDELDLIDYLKTA